MKKISAVLLAVMLIVSAAVFTSCKKKTAYEVFSEALEKTKSLDSVEFNMDMATSVPDEDDSGIIKYSAKISGLGGSPIASGDVAVESSGVSMKSSVYNADGFAYIGMGEMSKTKAELDEPTALMYDLVSMFRIVTASLPEEVFADAKVVENSDKTNTVTVSLTQEQFEQYFKGTAFETKTYTNGLPDDGTSSYKITIEDVKVSVTVGKDGYISKYEAGYKISIKVSIGGSDVDFISGAVTAVGVNLVNPGSTVTVDVPADLDSYVSG